MTKKKGPYDGWDFDYAHELWKTNPPDWRANAEASYLAAQVLLEAMRAGRWLDRTPSSFCRTGHFESRYMLLMGLAFECLFKGLVFQDYQSRGEIVPERLLEKLTTEHSVVEYARLTFRRSAVELALLRRLESFVIWAGKYAVPHNADELKKSVMVKNATKINQKEIAVLDGMFAELVVTIEPAPWPYVWGDHLRAMAAKEVQREPGPEIP